MLYKFSFIRFKNTLGFRILSWEVNYGIDIKLPRNLHDFYPEEGPPITIMLSFERKILVRESSRTETAQLSRSYETCVELRGERFDETADSTDARLRAAKLNVNTFHSETRNDRRWPIPNLFLYMS